MFSVDVTVGMLLLPRFNCGNVTFASNFTHISHQLHESKFSLNQSMFCSLYMMGCHTSMKIKNVLSRATSNVLLPRIPMTGEWLRLLHQSHCRERPPDVRASVILASCQDACTHRREWACPRGRGAST